MWGRKFDYFASIKAKFTRYYVLPGDIAVQLGNSLHQPASWSDAKFFLFPKYLLQGTSESLSLHFLFAEDLGNFYRKFASL